MVGEQTYRTARYERPAPASDLGTVVFGLLGAVLGGVARLTGRVALRHPFALGALVVIGAGGAAGVGGQATVAVVVVLVALAIMRWRCRSWWRARADAWDRWRWARWLIREWPTLCGRVGLTVTDRDRRTGSVAESTPGLTGLTWSPGGEVLSSDVRLVPGQLVDDFGEVADRLAEAADAFQCRLVRTAPGQARLSLFYADPLTETIAPMAPTDPVDLAGLPVGVREDGQAWRLRLAGTHILIAGVTGAGKGSVVWSLLRAVAPAIRDGSVRVWAVDGKAGMELAPGRALFTRFATTVEDGIELLEEAVQVMTDRAARLAGVARTHTATVDDPLLLVVVDEVALLTAYVPDRKLRDRAERALAALATQGRAPGVVLVAALQDPRKEVLGLRNLFPTKIGMRLDEKAQVDMVLGEGARDAGALCHKIPETQPGVAYVKLDGQREPVRVRAGYLDDAAITELAGTHPAPAEAASDAGLSLVKTAPGGGGMP